MLSNAIKFSPKTSSVEITASSKDGKLQISVSDNGKGIANDKLESIFREFEQDEDQAEKGTHRITASSGLGLTISKKIIEDHKGCMGCYNKDTGGCGAVFYISLPILHSIQLHSRPTLDADRATG